MIFRSLSFRLTLHTFLLTYLLVVGCWGLIYFTVDRRLADRDQEVLTDRLKTIQGLLQIEKDEPSRLIRRVEKEWPERPFERILVRVLDEKQTLIAQTPGLSTVYEGVLQSFPLKPVKMEPLNKLMNSEWNSHVFSVGSFIVPVGGEAPQSYIVEIALEKTSEEELLRALQKTLGYILAVGFVGSFLIGRHTVSRVLSSIQEISEIAKRVTSSGLNERLNPKLLPIEFKEIAQTLNEMLNRLEESFERLKRFSEDMAHELRTPLNNLLGELEVGLSKERTSEEYQSLIGSSVEECGRLKRIIDSLLFIARSHQPLQEAQKHKMHLAEEIETILSFYEVSAEKKRIVLRQECPADIDLRVERTLFQRALGNLLSNAIRHSPEDSEILVSIEVKDPFVEISVRDQGEGIAEEFLPRVGERFFRVEASRSQSSGGHGLGLSIVQSIVQVHGGRMKVESTLGKGSTFHLQFPI